MIARTVTVEILQDGSACAIPVPFDPKAVFGKVRAPVRVTIGGHTYRSTIFRMRGQVFIPLRRSHREAAGVEGGETVEVRIELDVEPRTVKPPQDLAEALKARPPAWERWKELSFTAQREWAEAVESAKRPETRARRIERAVREIGAGPPKKRG